MSDIQNWRRVSANTPCPICGKPDWCKVLLKKKVVICSRIEEGCVAVVNGGGFLHVLDDTNYPIHV